ADKPARVLIAAFHSAPADQQVARSARNLLRVILFNIPNLRPFKPAEVSSAMQGMGLGTAELQGGTALRVAEKGRADLVIAGSVGHTAGGFRIETKAIRVPQGKEVAECDARFSSAAGAHRAIGELCRKLQIALVGPAVADVSGLSDAVASLASENSSAIEE